MLADLEEYERKFKEQESKCSEMSAQLKEKEREIQSLQSSWRDKSNNLTNSLEKDKEIRARSLPGRNSVRDNLHSQEQSL
jgi:predicted RNase H-like nuclease (RuvC/YqgF family)